VGQQTSCEPSFKRPIRQVNVVGSKSVSHMESVKSALPPEKQTPAAKSKYTCVIEKPNSKKKKSMSSGV